MMTWSEGMHACKSPDKTKKKLNIIWKMIGSSAIQNVSKSYDEYPKNRFYEWLNSWTVKNATLDLVASIISIELLFTVSKIGNNKSIVHSIS